MLVTSRPPPHPSAAPLFQARHLPSCGHADALAPALPADSCDESPWDGGHCAAPATAPPPLPAERGSMGELRGAAARSVPLATPGERGAVHPPGMSGDGERARVRASSILALPPPPPLPPPLLPVISTVALDSAPGLSVPPSAPAPTGPTGPAWCKLWWCCCWCWSWSCPPSANATACVRRGLVPHAHVRMRHTCARHERVYARREERASRVCCRSACKRCE
eukprot:355604-Chlamydomonas_euryale.AAC.4